MSDANWLPRGALSACALMLLSGCSSVSNMLPSTSSLLGTSSSASTEGTAAAPGADDLECPTVEVRTGASTLTVNAAKSAPGEDPGALALRYQGTIGRTARECRVNSGVITVKVGIEGRVVVGPAGGPGDIDIPIRFAVVKEGPDPKAIVTRLHRVSVAIGPDQQRANFSLVADDVSFPVPVPAADIDAYVIYIGFDPQAEKPKPAPRKPAAKPAARKRQRI